LSFTIATCGLTGVNYVTNAFLRQDIWPEITGAVKTSSQRCYVAVAYFGHGASGRLPLPKGSFLVVNASEAAVASGQTCPEELKKTLARGISVYSVANLHAKVFVVGRKAYIRSNNVSNNSATNLLEVAIRTTDPKVVSVARKFVQENCLDELTPKFLNHLSKLYRPPIFPGGRKMMGTSLRPALHRVLLAQFDVGDWSEREQRIHDEGLLEAKKHREHLGRWETCGLLHYGKCPFQPGDTVLQVTDEDRGRFMVAPPGKVIHVNEPRREAHKLVTFYYIERPNRRQRSVKSLAKALGCKQKLLRRKGVVRGQVFVQSLLKVWTGTS
jgi:hypothetical protein